MTEHTPGPWTLSDRGVILAADDKPLVGEHRRLVAERDATARLIAAAPDMLAALKLSLPAIYSMHDHNHPVVLAVDAAIAKAEGR